MAGIALIPEWRQQVEGLLGGGGGDIPTPYGDIVDHNSNCKSAGGYTIWRSSGCLNGKKMDGLEMAIKGTGRCTDASKEFARKYRCDTTVHNSNCYTKSGYTIWKSSGCLNGKVLAGLEYAVLGNGLCSQAKAGFLAKYKCAAKVATDNSYVSSYTAAHNPTEDRVSIS